MMKPEASILGILIAEPRAIDEVLATGLEPIHFQIDNYREVFTRMLILDGEGGSWDLPTLGGMLPELAILLVDLVESAPLTQNASYFAKEIVAASRRRVGIEGLTRMAKMLAGHEPFSPMDDADSEMHRVFMDLFAEQGGSSMTPGAAPTALKLADEYEATKADRDAGRRPGLDSGFTGLNNAMGGFRKRAVYVLGARTGMGKTTLAINMARSASADGSHVAFFTVEMADTQIAAKAMSDFAGVPHTRIIDGDLTDEQETRFFSQLEVFGKGTMAINDKAGQTIDLFEAECRRLKRAKQLDMAILDYVQLMRDPSKRYQSRGEEISAISGRIKRLALSLNIPILILAQINREATKATDKKPNISQLKDSGAIEQDADGILLLHRDSYYEKSDGKNVLILAKNRFGSPGTLDIGCDLSRSRFIDLDK